MLEALIWFVKCEREESNSNMRCTPKNQKNRLFAPLLFVVGMTAFGIGQAFAQSPVVLKGAVELPDPNILPPDEQLPLDTKETLERVTKAIQPPPLSAKNPEKPIVIDRAKPSTHTLSDGATATGSSFPISMREEKVEAAPDVDELITKAYQAAAVGHLEASLVIYKQILALSPKNETAWFGLATSYQRLRQFSQAKPYYTKLLSAHPDNQAALTNFIALVREEAPADAYLELKKLEKADARLSAIPAQMGMIAMREGKNEEAIQYLRRAVAMEPGNMSYRYNLAIILDKANEWSEAAPLYRQLLVAAEHGVPVPGNIKKIRERLAFIQRSQYGD